MHYSAKVIAISEHRGRPRLWLQGDAPASAGFTPGKTFSVEKSESALVLRLDSSGNRVVSRKVTSKKGKVSPVIDINSLAELHPLLSCGYVKVVFCQGTVTVTLLASEARRRRRLARTAERVTAASPLSTAGIAAGGGVLTHALHAGLRDEGLRCVLELHNELREDLIEQAAEHNPRVTSRTKLLAMPLQELAFDPELSRMLPEVDIVEMGLPCSGASRAGRAKRALSIPEEHPEVGHLVVGALALLAALNPTVILVENVPQYRTSASAALLRRQLQDWGYLCHESVLFGPDFGELEARNRWCLVAVTKGIAFDLLALPLPATKKRKLASVLEHESSKNCKWSAMPGLKAKEARDLAQGKGFRMQVFGREDTSIGTLTKGLLKNRSTDPKIQHPVHSNLLRVPTVGEHARVKGIPERLVEGLPATTAHELLGQSIVYGPFRGVAAHIARALKAWARGGTAIAPSTPSFIAAG